MPLLCFGTTGLLFEFGMFVKAHDLGDAMTLVLFTLDRKAHSSFECASVSGLRNFLCFTESFCCLGNLNAWPKFHSFSLPPVVALHLHGRARHFTVDGHDYSTTFRPDRCGFLELRASSCTAPALVCPGDHPDPHRPLHIRA